MTGRFSQLASRACPASLAQAARPRNRRLTITGSAKLAANLFSADYGLFLVAGLKYLIR
jgi:hypothetical protein